MNNLVRKKLVSAFILSLIKTRNVQFHLLAEALNDEVKSASNERRIQQVNLDYEQTLYFSHRYYLAEKSLCV